MTQSSCFVAPDQNASFRPMDRAVEGITLLFILIGGITAAWLLLV